jgi:predicted enzyme related to lactoylglutathione lyase
MSTSNDMDNRIVHFEIAGRDGAKLESFYSNLFGWQIERREIGGFPYGFIKTGNSEDGFDGGIRHEPEGQPEIVVYVQVPNLSAAVAKAEELGGQVRVPPVSTEALTFAVITDPEGNPVGLIEKA